MPESEKRFNLKDGQRPITFLGWKIAEADSQSGNDVRWTELTLYKTLTGKYVLEKIGRSDVFHADDCSRRSKSIRFENLDVAAGNDDDMPEDLFVPCAECRPSYSATPVWVERDISSAIVLDSAENVVSSLFYRESGNTRFLSRVSRALLDSAAMNDENIKKVVETPADVT